MKSWRIDIGINREDECQKPDREGGQAKQDSSCRKTELPSLTVGLLTLPLSLNSQ